MEIGIRQSLKVMGEAKEGGFWVGDRGGSAWLSERAAPEGLEIGTHLEVFVFSDRDGNPVATVKTPKVQSGEFACLEVVDVVGHGAYLDWGLERDLFVPHGLMHRALEVGQRVVVAVDVDLDGRVYASSQLVDFFELATRVRVGAQVSLMVYSLNDRGALVVVNGRYTGMIYHNEVFQPVATGDELTGWVREVREDGRLDITLQRGQRAGTLDARERVWQAVVDGNGFLALTDKSSPAEIRDALQMSKKVFKKAVGSLYKERRITIDAGGISARSQSS